MTPALHNGKTYTREVHQWLEGRHLQAVLEDAMNSYIEARRQRNVRPEVMAHYRASLERNRLLAELLAQ